MKGTILLIIILSIMYFVWFSLGIQYARSKHSCPVYEIDKRTPIGLKDKNKLWEV